MELSNLAGPIGETLCNEHGQAGCAGWRPRQALAALAGCCQPGWALARRQPPLRIRIKPRGARASPPHRGRAAPLKAPRERHKAVARRTMRRRAWAELIPV